MAKLKYNQKVHYRMYKAGKRWLFAGVLTFTAGSMLIGGQVHADTTSTATSTAESAKIGNSPTDSTTTGNTNGSTTNSQSSSTAKSVSNQDNQNSQSSQTTKTSSTSEQSSSAAKSSSTEDNNSASKASSVQATTKTVTSQKQTNSTSATPVTAVSASSIKADSLASQSTTSAKQSSATNAKSDAQSAATSVNSESGTTSASALSSRANDNSTVATSSASTTNVKVTSLANDATDQAVSAAKQQATTDYQTTGTPQEIVRMDATENSNNLININGYQEGYVETKTVLYNTLYKEGTYTILGIPMPGVSPVYYKDGSYSEPVDPSDGALGVTKHFTIFTFDSLVAQNLPGNFRLAVGGNLTLSGSGGSNLAAYNQYPQIIVGGDTVELINSGTGGDIYTNLDSSIWGAYWAKLNIYKTNTTDFFTAAKAALASQSSALSNLKQTDGAEVIAPDSSNPNLTLKGVDGADQDVFVLNSTDLPGVKYGSGSINITNVTNSTGGTAKVIINVIGNTATLANTSITVNGHQMTNDESSNITWNMPDVVSLVTHNAGISGNILAPNATFYTNGSISDTGNVAVKKYVYGDAATSDNFVSVVYLAKNAKVLESDSYSFDSGSSETVKPKNFAGYTLETNTDAAPNPNVTNSSLDTVDPKTGIVSVKFDWNAKNDNLITYSYKPNAQQLTVTYEDTEGNELATSYLNGYTDAAYKTTDKLPIVDADDYTFKQVKSGSLSGTFTVDSNGKLTTPNIVLVYEKKPTSAASVASVASEPSQSVASTVSQTSQVTSSANSQQASNDSGQTVTSTDNKPSGSTTSNASQTTSTSSQPASNDSGQTVTSTDNKPSGSTTSNASQTTSTNSQPVSSNSGQESSQPSDSTTSVASQPATSNQGQVTSEGQSSQPAQPINSAAPVLVEAEDVNGNIIFSEKIFDPKDTTGNDYRTQAPSLPGYTWDGKVPTNASGTYTSQMQTVIYHYVENIDKADRQVTVTYIYPKGSGIANRSETEQVSYGSSYQLAINSPVANYHELQVVGRQSGKWGDLSSDKARNQVFVFCAIDSGKLQYKYIDLAGNDLSDLTPDDAIFSANAPYGYFYSLKAAKINGYTLISETPVTGEVKSPLTVVTFKYAKDSQVTTNYVATDGTTLSPATTQTLTYGKTYQTSALTLPGYKLITTPANATGTYQDSNPVSVTYVYEPVTIQSAQPSQAGSNVSQNQTSTANSVVSQSKSQPSATSLQPSVTSASSQQTSNTTSVVSHAGSQSSIATSVASQPSLASQNKSKPASPAISQPASLASQAVSTNSQPFSVITSDTVASQPQSTVTSVNSQVGTATSIVSQSSLASQVKSKTASPTTSRPASLASQVTPTNSQPLSATTSETTKSQPQSLVAISTSQTPAQTTSAIAITTPITARSIGRPEVVVAAPKGHQIGHEATVPAVAWDPIQLLFKLPNGETMRITEVSGYLGQTVNIAGLVPVGYHLAAGESAWLLLNDVTPQTLLIEANNPKLRVESGAYSTQSMGKPMALQTYNEQEPQLAATHGIQLSTGKSVESKQSTKLVTKQQLSANRTMSATNQSTVVYKAGSVPGTTVKRTAAKHSMNKLPQTGESPTSIWTVIGLALLSSLGMLIGRRRSEKN